MILLRKGKSHVQVVLCYVVCVRFRSSGAGHFTGVGREGRLRRDDDRDRTRNLPNRFRNKRNEESVAGMEDKSDKHIDKEKVLNERGNTRQVR